MALYRPAADKEIAELVAECAATRQTLEIFAGGSKRAFGRPVAAAHEVDLSRLDGILAYEAAELVLTARPATPLAAIEAVLSEKGQMLAFEPPLWRDLLQTLSQLTLGGVLACNLSGRAACAPAPRAISFSVFLLSTCAASCSRPAARW